MNDQPQCEMPRYRCHKSVHALKLKDIEGSELGIHLIPADKGFAPIEVSKEWYQKHVDTDALFNKGDVGYLVQYADGYRSWSPTKAFEEGYRLDDGKRPAASIQMDVIGWKVVYPTGAETIRLTLSEAADLVVNCNRNVSER